MNSSPLKISAGELTLAAASLADLLAEREGREALARRLGAAVAADWPPGEHDRDALEFFIARMREGGAAAAGWYAWYAIAQSHGDTELVGAVGYHGPPTPEGSVEIGFSILPAFRGRGHALACARALVARAFAAGVTRVTARTGAENRAAQTVLARTGFTRLTPDPEPGRFAFVIHRPAAVIGTPEPKV